MIRTIQETITLLEELLHAAKQIETALAAKDEANLREGLKTFSYHTDGYWGALVVRPGTDAAYDWLESLENEESEDAASPDAVAA